MTTPNTVDALISEALDHVQALERVPGQTSGSVQRHATLAANALRTIEASASALAAMPAPSEAERWAAWVAGMVGSYLGFEVDDKRNVAIAGIIKRRLWGLSSATLPPAIAAGDSGARERVAFEAWFNKDFLDDMDDTGPWDAERNCYTYYPVHMAFQGWQARAALATKPQAVVAPVVAMDVIVDAYAFPAVDAKDLFEVKVQRTRQIEGPALWKVVDGKGNCLNKQGEWEWEPMPSSRDDEFLARCRFVSADEAIRAASNSDPKGGV